MSQRAHNTSMFTFGIILITAAVGALAPRYGVDSRRDERNW